jgi:hypothetical protein
VDPPEQTLGLDQALGFERVEPPLPSGLSAAGAAVPLGAVAVLTLPHDFSFVVLPLRSEPAA